MPEPAPTDVSVERAGAWQIIRRELANAPRQAKRGLLLSFLGFDAALALGVYDLIHDPKPDETLRLLALFFAILGAAALVAAQVVHQLSQGRECNWLFSGHVGRRGAFFKLGFPTLQSEKFHSALLGVPLLALIAVILLAISVGIMLPTVRRVPIVAAVVIMVVLYMLYAARFVYLTTQFLFRHAGEQAEAAARARAEATEAQLAALRAQMNPHFLFNALNTVAALVRTNGRAAEETVEHLAEVLRRTLDRSRSNSGSVADEIDYLKAYLAVEQQRYGARLQVQWSVDPATLNLHLPPLTLQPLVENALRHGIGSRLEGGRISIETVRSNGHLQLTVADNGAGFPARHHEGTGLGNLRQRLQTLYAENQTIGIDSSAQGTRISIEIPASED
jgi:sensor histidine kinase YesM